MFVQFSGGAEGGAETASAEPAVYVESGEECGRPKPWAEQWTLPPIAVWPWLGHCYLWLPSLSNSDLWWLWSWDPGLEVGTPRRQL